MLVRQEFLRAAERWKEETRYFSSVQEIILNTSYQRIIGLGERVIPHILSELARETDHWFWALRALVGKDVAQGATSMTEAANLWLAWGRQNSLL